MNGIELIAEEREKQRAKGYTEEHDKNDHDDGSLAGAACAIALDTPISCGPKWAWQLRDKHSNRLKRLTIAGALITAEIDRVLAEQGQEDALTKAGIL